MIIDYNYFVFHFSITLQALPCSDRRSGNVLSVPHVFLADVLHVQLKNKMKKYQFSLIRI